MEVGRERGEEEDIKRMKLSGSFSFSVAICSRPCFRLMASSERICMETVEEAFRGRRFAIILYTHRQPHVVLYYFTSYSVPNITWDTSAQV